MTAHTYDLTKQSRVTPNSRKRRIVFGIQSQGHTALMKDELTALEALGYQCSYVIYGRNNHKESKLKKLIPTIKNAFKIVSELRKEKPDVLFLNSRFSGIGNLRDFITIFIIKRFYQSSLKIIIKTHGSETEIWKREKSFYRTIILPFLVRNVDSWIFLSQEEKDIIAQHCPELHRKTTVIPNVVVPERCFPEKDFKDKYPFPPGKIICLFAGNMIRSKGVFDIVRCIKYLKEPLKFHFIFVGRGDDLNALKSEARAYDQITSIVFTGFLPDTVCDQFYGSADILIYPTYFPEGFPMALFKATACGLPVITTRTRAAIDHLKEPDNTIWVNPQSPKEVADALERIVANPQLRLLMSENNRKLGEKFLPQKIGKELAVLIDGIPDRK